MFFSSFAKRSLIFIHTSRLMLILFVILVSESLFSTETELVPEDRILELITSDEVADILNNGKNLRKEIFTRVTILCRVLDKSLSSLSYAKTETKKRYCDKTDLTFSSLSEHTAKISWLSEHTKAAGFAMSITCGLFVVLPSSLCDYYCPAYYHEYASYGAALGLIGMIGGISAHLLAELNENYERCCPRKIDDYDYETNLSFSDGEDDTNFFSDDEKDKNSYVKNIEQKEASEKGGPRPVLLSSIKCI